MYQGGKIPSSSGGNKHDRSGAGEERYAALCAGCDGSERNGVEVYKILMFYYVKLGWWLHGLREEK